MMAAGETGTVACVKCASDTSGRAVVKPRKNLHIFTARHITTTALVLGVRWREVGSDEGKELRHVPRHCIHHCIRPSIERVRGLHTSRHVMAMARNLDAVGIVAGEERDDEARDVVEIEDGRICVQAHRVELVAVLQCANWKV